MLTVNPLTELEALYQDAYDNDINVINVHFSPTKKAACLCGVADNILLDKERIETDAEEAEHLIHELIHIKSGSLYFLTEASNAPNEKVIRQKAEARTRRDTVLELLPPEELQDAIYSEGAEFWRIAEYCGRTVEFVIEAFELYERMGIDFDIPEWE